ncbi:MAG: hypothetical protein R2873_20575 [Caldilineaceae bacterium]
MSQPQRSNPPQHESAVYEIRVQGHLGTQWTDWFDDMVISHKADGVTVLTGAVVDQAALHRMLRTIRDLGLPLLSVVRIE